MNFPNTEGLGCPEYLTDIKIWFQTVKNDNAGMNTRGGIHYVSTGGLGEASLHIKFSIISSTHGFTCKERTFLTHYDHNKKLLCTTIK